MPKVPVLTRQVKQEAVTPPAPVTLRPPAAAFGGDVAEAQGRLGSTLAAVGKQHGDRLVAFQEKLDVARGFEVDHVRNKEIDEYLHSTVIDPKTGRPKGLLARQLGHAEGISIEFAAQLPKLRERYLQMAQGENMKEQVAHSFDVYSDNVRERVSQHEAEQLNQAFEHNTKQTVATDIGEAGMIISPSGLAKHIQLSQEKLAMALAHTGYTPEQMALPLKTHAGMLLEANVDSLLDINPRLARRMYEANKDRTLPTMAAKIRDKIIGKELYDKKLTAWNVVRSSPSLRSPDGTIDIQKVTDYVFTQAGSSEDKEKVLPFVQNLASEANTQLRQQWSANDRDYYNKLLDLHKKGGTLLDAIPLATQNARDMANIGDREDTARKLMTDQLSRFDVWFKKADDSQRHAWMDARNQIETKFGKAIWTLDDGTQEEAAKLVTQEIQKEIVEQRGSLSGPQISELVRQRLDKRVVSPFSILGIRIKPLDKKRIDVEVEINKRRGLDAMTARLENDYGALRVAQARRKLQAEGHSADPDDIEDVLLAKFGARRP